MALGGTSYDGPLMGYPSKNALFAHRGYVAVTSVENSDLWYWGKVIFDPAHSSIPSV
jgi:hypothetical protein